MEYETLISLGYNCQTRFTFDQLTKIGPEFVLDGMVSHKLPKVIELLRNEFATFFLENQTYEESVSGPFRIVKDGLNEITSCHDFLADVDFEEAYKSFTAIKSHQYTKLMRTVKDNPGKLLFVRRNKAYEKLDSIVELRDTIAKLRGCKDFDLYVFQNKEWMNDNWGVPNLYTFYDGWWTLDEKKGWTGGEDLWHAVFKQVKFNHAFLEQ